MPSSASAPRSIHKKSIKALKLKRREQVHCERWRREMSQSESEARSEIRMLCKWFFHNFERRISWKLFSERKFRHAFLLYRYSIFVRCSHSLSVCVSSSYQFRCALFFLCLFRFAFFLQCTQKTKFFWLCCLILRFLFEVLFILCFLTCVCFFPHISYSYHQKYPKSGTYNTSQLTNTFTHAFIHSI